MLIKEGQFLGNVKHLNHDQPCMFTISVLLVQKSDNQLDCQQFELIKQSSGNALNKSGAIFTRLGLPSYPTSPVPMYRSASVLRHSGASTADRVIRNREYCCAELTSTCEEKSLSKRKGLREIVSLSWIRLISAHRLLLIGHTPWAPETYALYKRIPQIPQYSRGLKGSGP